MATLRDKPGRWPSAGPSDFEPKPSRSLRTILRENGPRQCRLLLRQDRSNRSEVRIHDLRRSTSGFPVRGGETAGVAGLECPRGRGCRVGRRRGRGPSRVRPVESLWGKSKAVWPVRRDQTPSPVDLWEGCRRSAREWAAWASASATTRRHRFPRPPSRRCARAPANSATRRETGPTDRRPGSARCCGPRHRAALSSRRQSSEEG